MSVIMAPFVFGGVHNTAGPATTPSLLPTSPLQNSLSSESSPVRPDVLPHRLSQSSPILPSHSNLPARQVKRNPLMQQREQAQNARRNLFFNSVRRRRDDQQWRQRGGDQELLKFEWLSLSRQLRHTKENDVQAAVSEADLDDAEHTLPAIADSNPIEADYNMIDAMEHEEELEMEQASNAAQPPTPQDGAIIGVHYGSDDEDYDRLFTELLAQETSTPGGDRMETG